PDELLRLLLRVVPLLREVVGEVAAAGEADPGRPGDSVVAGTQVDARAEKRDHQSLEYLVGDEAEVTVVRYIGHGHERAPRLSCMSYPPSPPTPEAPAAARDSPPLDRSIVGFSRQRAERLDNDPKREQTRRTAQGGRAAMSVAR